MTDNIKIISLNKILWMKFGYFNQEGLYRNTKPDYPSVRGIQILDNTLAHPHEKYPNETLLERARRLDILDVWTPVTHCQLQANRVLTFTGRKAVSIFKAWKAKCYNNN